MSLGARAMALMSLACAAAEVKMDFNFLTSLTLSFFVAEARPSLEETFHDFKVRSSPPGKRKKASWKMLTRDLKVFNRAICS